MMNENYNGVEPQKGSSEVAQAPKAKTESIHSLDNSVDLDAKSDSKASIGPNKAEEAAGVKFTKNADESAVEIGDAQGAAFAGMGKDELMKYANDPFWIRLRWSLFILFWLAWLGMLVGAIVIVVLAPKCPAPAPLEYWQKGVVYSVNVKSFQDGIENDGKGDLKGLMGRLDHFVHLGVDMIAVSPIYKSDGNDYGHDIVDFTDVQPEFGTLQDFKDLVDAAKAKNLKVIMDFVPNHSSLRHSWFTKSEKNDPEFADYYIWQGNETNQLPNNWASVFGGSAWTYSPTRKQSYYHKYSPNQPDLNFRSEKFLAEMNKTLKFWLDQGSSGFRLLSVPYLFEAEDITLSDNADQIRTKNLDETYKYIGVIRSILKEYEDKDGEHRVLLVEADKDSDTASVVKYYGSEEDKLADMSVNAQLIKEVGPGFDGDKLRQVIQSYSNAIPKGAWPNWVLGDTDTPRTSSRLGTALIDGLSMVQLLLPGTPISYYGEEIGMEDVRINGQAPGTCSMKPTLGAGFNCDQARSPFQWDDTLNGGFTNTTPWLPLGDVTINAINAKAQMGQSTSHSGIYKTVVDLRKKPAIMYGDLSFPQHNKTNILSFTRIRKGSPGYLVILNTADSAEQLDLSAENSISSEVQVVVRSSNHTMTKLDKASIEIGGQEGMVLSFVPKF